ncbi:MAG: hypothetical protein VB131_04025 [Burkholderia gladioli]
MADFDDSGISGFGGAFGGAGNALLAPMIGQQGMSDARANALMNIGAAMMQASAPSLDPSHRSFGNALGAGLLAGQAAYQGGMDRGIRNASAAQQMYGNRLGLLRQLMLMRQASKLDPSAASGIDLAGFPSSPGMPTASGFPSPPGMPVAGSTSTPPTDAGGAEAASAPPVAGSAASPTEGRATSALNPLGIPGPLAANMLLTNPEKYLETQATAYAPTDFAKTLIAQGIQPGMPEWNAQMGAYTRKQTYLPMVSGRPGSVMFDQNTGQFFTTPAAPAPGYQNIQAGTLPNGQPLFEQIPVRGARAAIKAAAAAESTGKAYGQVETGVDANGNPTYINRGALADQTAGLPTLGGGTIDAALGASGGGFPTPPNVRPGLSAQDQAANSVMGKRSGDQYAGDLNAAGGMTSRLFTLDKALAGLQNSTTGPHSDAINGAKSFFSMLAPDTTRALGIDPNRIASYDEANKYLTQFAVAQASALGQSTDTKLATILSGNASTRISNLAAQDVVRANIALERMKYALTSEFQKSGRSASQYSSWLAQANTRVSPGVFAWDSMTPDQKAKAAGGMNAQQKKAFTTQYNWALQNGYINGPGQ